MPESQKLQSYQIKPATLLLFYVGMVMGGSSATIFGKMINQDVTIDVIEQTADGEETVSKDVEFKHPLIMNMLMFTGEIMLLLFLQIYLMKNPEAALAHQQNKANPLLFLSPAFLDVCGSFLNFTGLALISASTYQILKMLSLVFVTFLSVTLLGRRYSFVQYLAIAVVITGLTIVSLQSINKNTNEDEEDNSADMERKGVIVGVCAMVWGQFFHGSQGVLEEYILKRSGGQEPLYMMGWEGVFGMIMTIMLLIPAQLFPCPFNKAQCVNNHADDIFIAAQQFQASPVLLMYGICFVFACTIFNGCGVSVTKFSTATNRTIVEQMRVIVIWVFFLLKPGFGHEVFSGVKLFGFVLILIGVLFFNKIFVFDGFSIKYKGGEEEKKPLEFKKNSSDEELTKMDGYKDEIKLPKLQLDDDSFDESTHSEEKGSRETHTNSATLRNMSLSTIQENQTEGNCTPGQLTDL